MKRDMKILVIGGGGREFTLCWKIAPSPLVDQIFCAPGNAGTSNLPKCENIDIQPTEIGKLLIFALRQKIDLTVVGPEDPLCMGLVDMFTAKGLAIVGPNQKAAELEGSKLFAKRFMEEYKIPTAKLLNVFYGIGAAGKFIFRQKKFPIVLKANGLAAGKGVRICHDREEAYEFVQLSMVEKIFGQAGEIVLAEEYLGGEEASLLFFSDGEHILPMASSQDHKPVYDNDDGPNTGGMGAYSPAPVVTPEIAEQVRQKIAEPTIKGMKKEKRLYRGILYVGVMIKNGIAKVLEFNARFGDPETQAILPRMRNDIVPILQACATGNLQGLSLDWDPRPCVCVVMASKGYPGSYDKGHIITGLELAEKLDNVIVCHSGTALDKDGNIITAGGRVVVVTAMDRNMLMTILTAYDAVDIIDWEGVNFRTDIGRKALKYHKV